MEKTSPSILAADSLPAGSSFQAGIEETGFKLRLIETTNTQTDTINKCKPSQNNVISLLNIVRKRFLVLVNMQIHCTRRKQNIVRSTCNFLATARSVKRVMKRALVLYNVSPYFHGPFWLKCMVFFKPFTVEWFKEHYQFNLCTSK